MRRRAWMAWGALASGLAFGLLGVLVPPHGLWKLLGGLLLLAAIVLGLSLLPFWSGVLAEPMPGLFTRPGPRERWCTRCGHPTPRSGACRTCGQPPRSTGN